MFVSAFRHWPISSYVQHQEWLTSPFYEQFLRNDVFVDTGSYTETMAEGGRERRVRQAAGPLGIGVELQ